MRILIFVSNYKTMTLAIGCDHAGFELKEMLVKHFEAKGLSFIDKGTYSADSTDYPDFAHAVAEAVEKGDVDSGILICGSANGVAMAANKHKDIRCAICWLPEISELARAHNNANIAALPARFVDLEEALEIVEVFIRTKFEGGRHERRVNKIPC